LIFLNLGNLRLCFRRLYQVPPHQNTSSQKANDDEHNAHFNESECSASVVVMWTSHTGDLDIMQNRNQEQALSIAQILESLPRFVRSRSATSQIGWRCSRTISASSSRRHHMRRKLWIISTASIQKPGTKPRERPLKRG